MLQIKLKRQLLPGITVVGAVPDSAVDQPSVQVAGQIGEGNKCSRRNREGVCRPTDRLPTGCASRAIKIDLWIFSKGVKRAGSNAHIPNFGCLRIGCAHDAIMLGQSPFRFLKGASSIPAESRPATGTSRLVNPISVSGMELEGVAIA